MLLGGRKRIALFNLFEMDPLNRNARTQAPPSSNPPRFPIEYKTYPGFSDILTGGCELDGIPILCDILHNLAEAGALDKQNWLTGKVNGKDVIIPDPTPVVPHGVGLFTVFEPHGIEQVESNITDTGEDRLFSFSHGVQRRKDCYEFADEVDAIARRILIDNPNPNNNQYPYNVNAFLDALARRFTEFGAATDVEVLRMFARTKIEGYNPPTEFGTEGFRPEYFDNAPGSENQARHTIFGLIIGHIPKSPAPLTPMPNNTSLAMANLRESLNEASGRADVALNNITVPMGESFRGPGGEMLARGLANWIRQKICNPR